MTECLGPDYSRDLHTGVRNSIISLGIEIIDFRHLDGFSPEKYEERDQISKNIEELRRNYGTFRSEAQTTAEAEVVLICETECVNRFGTTRFGIY
jgi:hypothetical protein